MIRKLIHKLAEIKNSYEFMLKKDKPTKKKVICVAYNKTGTTSLGKGLELLGYDHCSFHKLAWNLYQDLMRKPQDKANLDFIIKIMRKYDSFDDLPFNRPNLIKSFQLAFPGSKYINLVREPMAWVKSYEKWSERTGRGPKPFDRQHELEKYHAHQQLIRSKFKDSADYLELDISKESGFFDVATFLGVEPKGDKFPWYNANPDRGFINKKK